MFAVAACLSLTTAKAPPSHPAPLDLDWSSMGFSLNDLRTPYMYLDVIDQDSAHPGTFDGAGGGSGRLGSGWASLENPPKARSLMTRHGPLALEPASTIINYGQGLFEGIKAFRRPNGSIVIFRPNKNAARMRKGCSRLLIPPIPDDTFVAACKEVVRYNAAYVPPSQLGALYLRPLVFGSGAKLGVAASNEFTFCIYCSPVGNYFKTSSNSTTPPPISLLVSNKYKRSCAGGAGGVKAVGNYAPVFLCQKETRDKGFNEALFVDAKEGKYIEEAGASNLFVFIPNKNGEGGTLATPPLDNGTILPGVTRDSILNLVRNEMPGVTVEERPVSLSDLGRASEAFCCGTGASVTPVGDVHVEEASGGDDKVYKLCAEGKRKAGPVTERIYEMLHEVIWGEGRLGKKYKDWIVEVEPLPERE